MKVNNFLGKKAQSTVLFIFEVLLVIFVIVSMVKIAKSFGSSEQAEKITIAEDLRMMVNTLVATTGDSKIYYQKDTSKYILRMNSGEISVFNKGDGRETWISRIFYLPEGYKAAGAIRQESKVCLTKQEKIIFLQTC
tara:strand:- start:13899 stop:14309 length:411 start_codon:yes stop_codon:yes gene_type:complete